jgi:hypothetical protein
MIAVSAFTDECEYYHCQMMSTAMATPILRRLNCSRNMKPTFAQWPLQNYLCWHIMQRDYKNFVNVQQRGHRQLHNVKLMIYNSYTATILSPPETLAFITH